MSDDLVREKLRLYATQVAPAQLPPFAGVSGRRHRRVVRRALASGCAAVLVLVVVLAAALGGVGQRESRAGRTLAATLEGSPWTLLSITTDGTLWPAPAGAQFGLSFSKDGYTGNDGCNATSGAVSYQAETIRLAAGPITEIGCTGADQTRMQAAFQRLVGVSLPAAVAGDQLTLTAGSTVVRLTRAPTTPQVVPSASVTAGDLRAALVKHPWYIRSFTNVDGGFMRGTTSDEQYRLTFSAGAYVVDDGCHSQKGKVTVGATSIVLAKGPVTTDAACAGRAGAAQLNTLVQMLIGAPLPAGVSGDVLLLQRRFSTIRLSGSPPGAPATSTDLSRLLPGTRWALSGIATPAIVAVSLNENAYLQFRGTKFVAGDGCTTRSDHVAYESSTVTFLQGRQSSPLCDESTGGVTAAYDTVLSGTATATLDGDTLTLRANGESLLFTPEPPAFVAHRDAAASSAAATAAAAAAGAVVQSELGQVHWRLTSMVAAAETWQAISTSTAGIVFNDSVYRATDGCSSIGGELFYTPTSLTFGVSDSAGSCSVGSPGSPAGTHPPAAFLAFFSGTASASVTDTSLTLTKRDTTLVFSIAPATTPTRAVTGRASGSSGTAVNLDLEQQLAGSTWALSSITVKGKPLSKATGNAAFLTFSSAGFHVNDGCNSGDGIASYSGGTITFGVHGMSAMSCVPAGAANSPPDPAEVAVEAAQDQGFNGVSYGAVIVGKKLSLTSPGLVFTYLAIVSSATH
jgi:heat shock protein HslJ